MRLIFALTLAMLSTLAQANAPSTCEVHLLHTFRATNSEEKISDVIVQSITSLRREQKINEAQLVDIANALAASEDGLTLGEAFWKTRTAIEWSAVKQLLTAAQNGANSLSAQLKQDLVPLLKQSWKQMASNQEKVDHHIEEMLEPGFFSTPSRDIFYTSTIEDSLFILDAKKLNGKRERISLTFRSGSSVVLDLDPKKGWSQILFGGATEAPVIGDDLVLTSPNAANKTLLKFHVQDEHVAQPEFIDITAPMRNTVINDFLVDNQESVDSSHAVGPGQAILVTTKYRNLYQDQFRFFFIDGESLTSFLLRDWVIGRSDKPQGFISLPGKRVFSYGRESSVGLLDFSNPHQPPEAHWTPAELNPLSSVHAGDVLSNGSPITYDNSANLIVWSITKGSAPIANTLKNYVTIFGAYEIAPNEVLTLGTKGVATYWDLRHNFDPVPVPLKFPEPAPLSHQAFAWSAKGQHGQVLTSNGTSLIYLITPSSPGSPPTIKSATVDVSSLTINDNFAPKFFSFDNGDVIVFGVRGLISYINFSDDTPVAKPLQDILGNPLQNRNVKEIFTLANGNFVTILEFDTPVEFNAKLIQRMARDE